MNPADHIRQASTELDSAERTAKAATEAHTLDRANALSGQVLDRIRNAKKHINDALKQF